MKIVVFSLLAICSLAFTVPVYAQNGQGNSYRYQDRRGDYLRARLNPRVFQGRVDGNGYSRDRDREVAYVPTAFYRTKDKFVATAYRPIRNVNRWSNSYSSVTGYNSSLVLASSTYRPQTTGQVIDYRLALPGTMNNEIAYYRNFIAVSAVQNERSLPTPGPTSSSR